MFLAPIPFDYATLLDSGDRVRKTKQRTTGTRLRRTPNSAATSIILRIFVIPAMVCRD